MHIHAVHLQVLSFIQISRFRFGWRHAGEPFVLVQNGDFQLLGLIGDKAKLGYGRRSMQRIVVVSEFSCANECV